MRFTIRDLLWLTVVVALLFAWLDQFGKRNKAENISLRHHHQLSWLLHTLDEHGYAAVWNDSTEAWDIAPPLPVHSAPARNSPKD